ncbi:LysR family transcriptional regulator [Halotalea alkalilenta]|uniref:Transcriptional regulator n=1 Tax=Halotalea alkalilenta TaxID=376489 RepID=A0A172YBS0_9GAMM|nr:LysR family transcriptional regulator [Halotalea alkalilenta]ANF56566.1 transcriptional regulator [Halotalea alkalilenta]
MNRHDTMLPWLVTFVRVVESGSFTAASTQLGLSPSAVSRQIGKLETGLSLRLFERSTRRLRLTESGQAAYSQAREMVDAFEATLGLAERLEAAPRGVLRVAMPKAFGKYLMLPLIPGLLERYPELELRLILDDRLVDPIKEGFDAMVRITETPPPGMAGRPLTEVEHLLCASPAYLERHGEPATPEALAEHACIFLGETPADSLWRLARGSEQRRVAVRGRYACNHSEARLEAALAGLGIATLPRFTAARALAEERLRRVLPEWRYTSTYHGTAWLLYPPKRFVPPRLRAFGEYLASMLEGHR